MLSSWHISDYTEIAGYLNVRISLFVNNDTSAAKESKRLTRVNTRNERGVYFGRVKRMLP